MRRKVRHRHLRISGSDDSHRPASRRTVEGRGRNQGEVIVDVRRLCKLGLHQFVDFPDPNPETFGRREAQGYQACTRCTKVRDTGSYDPRRASLSGRAWWSA
jgi:hypothetical protein